MPSKAPRQHHQPGTRGKKSPVSVPAGKRRKSFKARRRVASTGNILLTPSEIRHEAKSPRERLLWDLRQQGCCLREIAETLGITRQRVSQIETRMIRRAVLSKSATGGAKANPRKMVWKKNASYVHLETYRDFERRLDALNARYEARLKRIVKRLHRWKKANLLEPNPSSLFRKVWPSIEHYQDKPFHFSKLIEDFPALAREPYVAQLLSRLRRKGLLRRVGTVQTDSHNLPEVLMARTRLEESAATQLDKLATQWALKLRELESRYRSLRPAQAQSQPPELAPPQDQSVLELGKLFRSQIAGLEIAGALRPAIGPAALECPPG